MDSIFKHNTGEGILPETAFRISPSQLSKFFDDTSNWYKEHVLKEGQIFKGNTASNLGTCLHVAVEMLTTTGKIDHNKIVQFINSISDPEIDKELIKYQYPIMFNTLKHRYLDRYKNQVETEKYVHVELLPNIYVAGSVDRIDVSRRRIIDWKTMGSLDSARVPTSFPRAYWFQQMTYVWILRKLGYNIEFAELVFITRDNVGRISPTTGKPMKDYPCEVHSIVHQVSDLDMEIIGNTLQLVAESVKAWDDTPAIRHLLSQDYRNKPKPKPKLFID